MFFLLRAAFWLSLIALVFWWSGPADSRRQTLDIVAAPAFDNAKLVFQKACMERPKMCLNMLEHLRQIALGHEQAAAQDSQSQPDPRRQIRGGNSSKAATRPEN